MTKEEFKLFALALKTYYPKDGLLPNAQAMDLWYAQLNDLPYEVASTALNKWVATNKWSPTIADIRSTSADLMQGEMPDWGAGWERVIKCIGAYGYNRQDDALETMDEITRECVKRLGWHNLCISENVMADRSNFRQIYEELSARKHKREVLPLEVKERIDQMGQKYAPPVLEVHEHERKGIEIKEREYTPIPPDVQAELDAFMGRTQKSE